MSNDDSINLHQQFLKLELCSNVVRIISKPYQYYCHPNIVRQGNPSYGQKIWCPKNYNGQCKICEDRLYELNDAYENTTNRWIVAVIDRKSNAVKYFDFGGKIFRTLQLLYRDKCWGDPIHYDIDLYVDEFDEGRPIKVLAHPPSPLTQSDLLLQEHTDLEYLDCLTNPTTSNANNDGKYEAVIHKW